MGEKNKIVGKVMSFYKKIGVAAVDLTGNLTVGDTILIKGHTTNFEQKVDSMQINNEKVEKVKKNDQMGIRVTDKVRIGDLVFKK